MAEPGLALRDQEPLQPADREAFQQAILAAYPSADDLEILLSFKWGVRLADEVYLQQPLKRVAFDLIKWVEAEGRARELLGVLWSERPGNPALRALAEQWLGDLDSVAARYDPAETAERAPQIEVSESNLQKVIVDRSRLHDFEELLGKLRGTKGPVCKVETPVAIGTGFLVGRRHVLTNFHVVEKALAMGAIGEQIICRFDYVVDENGEPQAGLPLPALAGAGWLVANSPYSQSDLSGTGSPGQNELDFALIRLAGDVEASRRNFTLPKMPSIVTPMSLAIIVQHPDGNPLKIAMGVITEVVAPGLRYRYNTITKAGASGAPVFNEDVELIGLHHAADPAKDPQFNQAVPVWQVAQALSGADHDLAAL